MILSNARFFINRKTRYCQILQGSDDAHQKNVAEALKSGFVEVTAEEQEAFSAETWKARDAGWNPAGRVSYAKFIEKQVEK